VAGQKKLVAVVDPRLWWARIGRLVISRTASKKVKVTCLRDPWRKRSPEHYPMVRVRIESRLTTQWLCPANFRNGAVGVSKILTVRQTRGGFRPPGLRMDRGV